VPAVATSPARSQKPDSDEFLQYYARYIDLVPEGDIVATLSTQMDETRALLRQFPETMSGYRYGPHKWSVNEVLGHLIDAERIFGVRALRFARNDSTPLPGFEQDDYVANANFDSCSVSELAAEFEAVRAATLFFFRHLDESAWMRRGTASNAAVSVRALAYIIAGHELHHRGILRDRYLKKA
jgi:uncharacterized damage-inducible protein DinB